MIHHIERDALVAMYNRSQASVTQQRIMMKNALDIKDDHSFAVLLGEVCHQLTELRLLAKLSQPKAP